MREMTDLGRYIIQLCERRNLSMRQGSLRSGLAPETISQIIRRGNATKPRPDTLQLIANALGGDQAHMMRLAGHLPAQSYEIEQRGIVRRRLEHVAEMLSDLPDNLQIQVADAIIVQVEAAKAIYEARPDYHPVSIHEGEEKNAAPS